MLYYLFVSRMFIFESRTVLVNIECFRTDAESRRKFLLLNVYLILVIQDDGTLIAFEVGTYNYGRALREWSSSRKWNAIELFYFNRKFFNSRDLNGQDSGCRIITATLKKNRSQIVILLNFP